ncbi:MAG TPA: DoxX family protein [Chthonomonadaceae bacterium]|nr:DoxX family protein [Chthonomonadaceae bacterium]
MNHTTNRHKTLYWVLTALFCIAMTLGGATELLEVPRQVEGIRAIGYPLYILPFLGVAKLLGVAAILYGKQLRLKEWAYAGFTFDLLGAVYSHAMSAQFKEALPPLIVMILCLATYRLWRKDILVADADAMQFKPAGGLP